MIFAALRTIAIGLAAPLFGVVVAQLALGALAGQPAGWESFFYGLPSLDAASARCAASPAPLCDHVFGLGALRAASFWSAIALIVVISLYLLLARAAGTSRARNAAIFPRLMPATTLAVALLIFVHGAVVTYGVFVLILWISGASLTFWAWIVVAVVGLGALLGAGAVVATLRRAAAESPTVVMARAVTRDDAPALWAYVDGVAETLGAERPDNIVVGLEPTFFATAAPVVTPEAKTPLKGETLYLSLPLMRLFSSAELDAVVGHELGHFRGGDTDYSMKFAPVYRGLFDAIKALEGDDGKVDWLVALPGAMMLRLMYAAFARNERAISREREFEADRAGLEVARPRDLGTSLAKVAVYAPVWGKTRADNIARINAGKISANLSTVFVESARFDVGARFIGDVLAMVLTHRVPHPTDSHPPVADRYEAIGFDAQTGLTLEALTEQGGAAGLLFSDLETLERGLTIIEHQVVVATGLAVAPDAPPPQDQLLNAAYVLAAAMVTADGDVDPSEVQMAEAVGARLFQGFDPVSFRDLVRRADEAPSFEQVVRILNAPLTAENKKRVHAFLLEIAAADGEIAPSEKALLTQAARIWRIARPLELWLPARRRGRRAPAAS